MASQNVIVYLSPDGGEVEDILNLLAGKEMELEWVGTLNGSDVPIRVRVADVDDSEDDEESTWTFIGHWNNDRVVVEYILPGDVEDTREDTGFWEQGLWAASGTGAIQEDVMADVIAEYEAPLHPDEEWECPGCHRRIQPSDVRKHVSECKHYDGSAGY